MHVGLGNLGDTLSAYLFLAKDLPQYIPGLSMLLAFQALTMRLSISMIIYLRRENCQTETHSISRLAGSSRRGRRPNARRETLQPSSGIPSSE